MQQLPAADPSLLPAMREAGGELGRQFVDVFVGFRLRFHDDREAFQFSQHFRFACLRSALRQEGAGVVWVGFHGWAFDAQDAAMQAALAVRHSAIKAKCRYIPVATEAEVRPTERRVIDGPKARAERDALLAYVDEEVPHMLKQATGPAIESGRKKRLQLGAGGGWTPPPPQPKGAPPANGSSGRSAAPPGFHAAQEAASRKRGIFGRRRGA